MATREGMHARFVAASAIQLAIGLGVAWRGSRRERATRAPLAIDAARLAKMRFARIAFETQLRRISIRA